MCECVSVCVCLCVYVCVGVCASGFAFEYNVNTTILF